MTLQAFAGVLQASTDLYSIEHFDIPACIDILFSCRAPAPVLISLKLRGPQEIKCRREINPAGALQWGDRWAPIEHAFNWKLKVQEALGQQEDRTSGCNEEQFRKRCRIQKLANGRLIIKHVLRTGTFWLYWNKHTLKFFSSDIYTIVCNPVWFLLRFDTATKYYMTKRRSLSLQKVASALINIIHCLKTHFKNTLQQRTAAY